MDQLGRHDGPVRAVAILADGRVVTAEDDGQVLVWATALRCQVPEAM